MPVGLWSGKDVGDVITRYVFESWCGSSTFGDEIVDES